MYEWMAIYWGKERIIANIYALYTYIKNQALRKKCIAQPKGKAPAERYL